MQRRKFLTLTAQTALAGAVLSSAALRADAQEMAEKAPDEMPDETPIVPDEMELFLLVGQSNMAGRGKPEAQDITTDPGIWMMNQQMNWVLARDPIHFDKPIAGVGLAHQFARDLVARDPNAKIGLIPAALGGSSMDEWVSGGALFENAVARAVEAKKHGKLKGILWHQGEADSRADRVASYADRFGAMIAQLRKELNAVEVPVVMGELVQTRPENAAFNAALPAISASVPLCTWVSSQGLEDRGDKLHFSPASFRELGVRYAAAFLKLQNAANAG